MNAKFKIGDVFTNNRGYDIRIILNVSEKCYEIYSISHRIICLYIHATFESLIDERYLRIIK